MLNFALCTYLRFLFCFLKFSLCDPVLLTHTGSRTHRREITVSKDCGRRGPPLRSISWLTLITDWLWADCLPSSRKSPPSPEACVCVCCVFVRMGELYMMGAVTAHSIIEEVRKGGLEGGGFDHHNTCTHTEMPGTRRWKQTSEQKTYCRRGIFLCATISTDYSLCYTSLLFFFSFCLSSPPPVFWWRI